MKARINGGGNQWNRIAELYIFVGEVEVTSA